MNNYHIVMSPNSQKSKKKALTENDKGFYKVNSRKLFRCVTFVGVITVTAALTAAICFCSSAATRGEKSNGKNSENEKQVFHDSSNI